MDEVVVVAKMLIVVCVKDEVVVEYRVLVTACPMPAVYPATPLTRIITMITIATSVFLMIHFNCQLKCH